MDPTDGPARTVVFILLMRTLLAQQANLRTQVVLPGHAVFFGIAMFFGRGSLGFPFPAGADPWALSPAS